ncbi:hypothetical protein EBS43_01970 [bacterium]|nr:hypothetical protein [bacterium]
MKLNTYRLYSHLLLLISWAFLLTDDGFANAHLDRQYRLESLGLLKSQDNVDHILSEYLENAYQSFFSQQSRFQAISSRAVDQALNDSKLPYSKIITDPEVLAQIARVTHADSLLRTQVVKSGRAFHFKVDWLHSPQTEVLGSVDFELDVPTPGSSFDQNQYAQVIQKNLALLIAQVPFHGQVTGRDHSSVTLSLGERDQLKSGDILTISTLDEVKRHPLLKNISEWKLSPTGKVRVEKVDREMSFANIIEEEPGKQISKYQKIAIVQHSPLLASNTESVPQELSVTPDYDPEIGWGAFSLPFGSYERSFSSRSPAYSYLGNPFTYGARVESNLLLNREFFTYIRLDYQMWNHQQNDASSGLATPASKNGGVPGSQTSVLISGGYQISLTHSQSGPQGWVGLGYKITSVNLPISSSEATSPYTFKSLLLGAGLNLKLKQSLSLETSLRYRIFSSVDASNLVQGASVNGTSDVEIYLGLSYKFNEQFGLRGGVEIQSLSAQFDNGNSLSQKTMTFAPALLYYF